MGRRTASDMAEFWAGIVLILVVTRIFRIIERRSTAPWPRQQPVADPTDIRRLEQEVADIRHEIAEMREAYTESIVQLQADVRQLRQRIDTTLCANQPDEITEEQTGRSGVRNLTERT
ncbi:MAG: hypothetical protein ACUVTZ_07655 [Armatimonadota bacterium]